MSFHPQKVVVHVRVITSQLLGKVSRPIVDLGLGDAGDAQILDEHVRRFQNESAHAAADIFPRR